MLEHFRVLALVLAGSRQLVLVPILADQILALIAYRVLATSLATTFLFYFCRVQYSYWHQYSSE